jgi:hypothetical protein
MSRIAQTTIASPTRRRHLLLATLATVLLGLTAAGRPALASDLRSPDARDAATAAQAALPAQAGTDLRSPDARDAATAALPAQAGPDLRSPDARDVAREEGPRVSSDLRSPDARESGRPQRRVSSPPASLSDGGFRWIYVAVGGLGLALLVSGATTRHIRRRVKHAPAVVGG